MLNMRRMLTALLAALGLLVLALPADPCSAAGMVSLSFDDGLVTVYNDAFPVLNRYTIPATVGIVLDRITTKTYDYLNVKQALELQKNGWEVASHGWTHKRPADIPVYFSDEPVKGWELEDEPANVFQAKYNYDQIAGLLENGERLKEVWSLDDLARSPGAFYFDRLISQLHLHALNPGDPDNEDIRAISYQREMSESKKGLEKLGFKISTYVTPYNYWTVEMAAISKYYYGQAADGGEAANFKNKFDQYWIKRIYVHTLSTPEELINKIQQNAVEKDGWVILCFHGIEDDVGWQPWSVEKLEELASWLREQKIKVVTISDGVSIFNTAK